MLPTHVLATGNALAPQGGVHVTSPPMAGTGQVRVAHPAPRDTAGHPASMYATTEPPLVHSAYAKTSGPTPTAAPSALKLLQVTAMGRVLASPTLQAMQGVNVLLHPTDSSVT